jgi:hypothetical protein
MFEGNMSHEMLQFDQNIAQLAENAKMLQSKNC